MQHYTYSHCRPDGTIFYIGKGSGDRAYRKGHRNNHWKNIVAKHETYTVDILAKWKTHEEALQHEVFLISCFKDMGIELANLTVGGEGVLGSRWSEEAKARMSAIKKGKPSGGKGIKRSPLSDETKQKMSAAKLGKQKTDAHRLNISLGKKGKQQEKLECPHCKKSGGVIMKRWHFDNCKDKNDNTL